MKAKKIFVGINGTTPRIGDCVALAVYPVQKGGNTSHVLADSGAVRPLKGARINGVGVARYLTEHGFELAQPGNEAAGKLADWLDAEEGRNLVSEALSLAAGALQKKFGGLTCTFVPFDSSKEIRQVQVEANCVSTSVRFDLLAGFSSAMVKTVYQPGAGYMDVALCDGWLVGPDVDASKLPRMTDAKELIEHAVYAMCVGGMGTLVGAQNLVPAENPAVDALYTRGMLEVALMNGDRLLVGGTSDDLLATQYLRDGSVLYSRVGSISAPKLGAVIGDIAAVLVRVKEMDAEPVKKALKKAA
jgi:hypothetical protein